MTVVLRAIICLILLVATIPAQPRSTWVTFAPKGAGFSISVPAKPAGRVLTRPTYTSHMFDVKAGGVSFTIAYADLKPEDPDLRAGLVANRDTIIEGLRGKLIESREITVDGHNGIEFTADSFFGDVTGQIFLIKNRMFQMMAIVAKGKNETRNVNRFFRSLRFSGG